MTLPKELEQGTARCANASCGKITHYLLVDPEDQKGMVFCSWECLRIFASGKLTYHDVEEFYKPELPNALAGIFGKLKELLSEEELREFDEFMAEGSCTDARTYQAILDEELIT